MNAPRAAVGLAGDLAAAFLLLTRLPVGRLARGPATGRGAWAWPVAGAAVGGLGALVFAATRAMLPAPLAACWTVAALLLATGALHEDGLADTADGLGGGATPERRLAIMRDSRIGSFGAAALVLTLAIRIAALASLNRPGHAAAALIAAGALARAAMLIPLAGMKSARPDGMAASLGPVPASTSAAAALLALTAALLLPRAAIVPALAAAALAGLAMRQIARRALGGITGDILGATAVLTECLVLSVAAALPAP